MVFSSRRSNSVRSSARRPELLNYYQLWLIIGGALALFGGALLAFLYYRFVYLERRRRAQTLPPPGREGFDPTQTQPYDPARGHYGPGGAVHYGSPGSYPHGAAQYGQKLPPSGSLGRLPSKTSYHNTTSYAFQPAYHTHTSSTSRTVRLDR